MSLGSALKTRLRLGSPRAPAAGLGRERQAAAQNRTQIMELSFQIQSTQDLLWLKRVPRLS